MGNGWKDSFFSSINYTNSKYLLVIKVSHLPHLRKIWLFVII